MRDDSEPESQGFLSSWSPAVEREGFNGVAANPRRSRPVQQPGY